jgi:hypothetical protein
METNLMQPDESLIPSIGEGLSKQEVALLATNVVDNVLEAGDVFKVAEAIAAMEEFAKNVRRDERFVAYLREELEKNNGRMTSASGARIENCEAAVKYDYSTNGEWMQLEEEIRLLQEKKKIIEEKLKRISPGRIVVDQETGEVWEGAARTSKSTYKITLSNGSK